MKRPRLLAAAMATVSAAAVVVTGVVGPTQAAPADDGPETCILNLASGSYRCYASTTAMLAKVTGGSVHVDSQEELLAPATVTELEQALSSVITAILYDDDGAEGGPRLIMEAPTGCDGDTGVEWAWKSLTAAWIDRINSGQGYSACQIKVWESNNYGGASYPWFSLTSSMGAMNNATNSVKMR